MCTMQYYFLLLITNNTFIKKVSYLHLQNKHKVTHSDYEKSLHRPN